MILWELFLITHPLVFSKEAERKEKKRKEKIGLFDDLSISNVCIDCLKWVSDLLSFLKNNPFIKLAFFFSF